MNWPTWAIRQPLIPILVFVVLTCAGLYGFRQLPIQNLPDLDLPTVVVSVAMRGATPAQLETAVTRKVEGAVAGIGTIKHLNSHIFDGVSYTYIEFLLEKDLGEALNDVRDALSRIRADLPADAREPIVTRVSLAAEPVLIAALDSPRLNEAELTWLVDNDLTRALLKATGVASVRRVGGLNREVRVDIDPDRLLAFDVTASDISRQLRKIQMEATGGRADIGSADLALRVTGQTLDLDALRNLRIPLAAGRQIELSSLATVSDDAADRAVLALRNGQPVVAFKVFRARGASDVSVTDAVRTVLRAFAAAHPEVRFTEINSPAEQTRQAFEASMHMLYTGALLAIVVVWLFLRDWRATLISAAALPLSVIPTFAILYALDLTLNVVTLLALALVVGILVDDAIVEIENIARHLGMGKSPMQATLDAVQEIGLAVVATTLTLVAVFLPTAFMGDFAGRLFRQFGWSASVAVLMSLLVARLLTPLMAARWMTPTTRGPDAKPAASATDGRLMSAYLRVVRACIARRGATSCGALAFLAVSMWVASHLTTTFVPAADLGRIRVNVLLPPGSNLQQTRATVDHARRVAQGVPEVTDVFAEIGNDQGERNKASLTITLIPRQARQRSQDRLAQVLREGLETIPGARFSIGGDQLGEKLLVGLRGDDSRVLEEVASRVAREMRGVTGLGGISSTASQLRPEVVIRPDASRAAALGVTTAAISDIARIATGGDDDVNLAKFDLPERQLNLRVQLARAHGTDLESLAQLRVPGADGLVPLGNVASLRIDSGPARIDRIDRSRAVILSADLDGAALGAMLARVDQLPALRALPPGVQRFATGEVERMHDLFGGFGWAMLAALICIYAVLVLLFRHALQPVTILSALPLAVGGALGLLWLSGHNFSLPSLIGLLTLMGIVTKNSILLVEYTIIAQRQHGMKRLDALIDACHKRARPILMTSVAMAAGMLPIALGLEADANFRAPMAIAVIGGLTTSTVLSLIVVPVVFTWIDDLGRRAWRGRA